MLYYFLISVLIILLTGCTTVNKRTDVYVNMCNSQIDISIKGVEMKDEKQKDKQKDKKDDQVTPQGGGRTPPPKENK